MSNMKEFYFRKTLQNPPVTLDVIGSGQDKEGADRTYHQDFTYPDGKVVPAHDIMVTNQMVQIRAKIPVEDAANPLSDSRKILYALYAMLNHKGYAAGANPQEKIDGQNVIIEISVVTKGDMGNAKNDRLVRQEEMAFDIKDSIAYLERHQADALQPGKINALLEKPGDSDSAQVVRSFPKLRKKLRDVVGKFTVTNREGTDMAPEIIENVVKLQYPRTDDAEAPAAPQPSHIPADIQKKSMKTTLFRMANNLNITDKHNNSVLTPFVTAVSNAVVSQSPSVDASVRTP